MPNPNPNTPQRTSHLIAPSLFVAGTAIFSCAQPTQADTISDLASFESVSAALVARMFTAPPVAETEASNADALYNGFGAPLGYPPVAPPSRRTTPSVDDSASSGPVYATAISAPSAQSLSSASIDLQSFPSAARSSPQAPQVAGSNSSRSADHDATKPRANSEADTTTASARRALAADSAPDANYLVLQPEPNPVPLPSSAAAFTFLAASALTLKLTHRPTHA